MTALLKVKQKSTKFCKAIIFQLKNKKIKKTAPPAVEAQSLKHKTIKEVLTDVF